MVIMNKVQEQVLSILSGGFGHGNEEEGRKEEPEQKVLEGTTPEEQGTQTQVTEATVSEEQTVVTEEPQVEEPKKEPSVSSLESVAPPAGAGHSMTLETVADMDPIALVARMRQSPEFEKQVNTLLNGG